MSVERSIFLHSEKGSQMCSGEKFNGQKIQRLSFLDTGWCLEESSWLSNLGITCHAKVLFNFIVLTGMDDITMPLDFFVDASNKVGEIMMKEEYLRLLEHHWKSSMMTETWHSRILPGQWISEKHQSWIWNGYRMLELSLPKQQLYAIERLWGMLKARSMVENRPIYSNYNSAKTGGQIQTL